MPCWKSALIIISFCFTKAIPHSKINNMMNDDASEIHLPVMKKEVIDVMSPQDSQVHISLSYKEVNYY